MLQYAAQHAPVCSGERVRGAEDKADPRTAPGQQPSCAACSVRPAVMDIGLYSAYSFYFRGVALSMGEQSFYRFYSVRIQAQLRDLSLYLLY